MLLILEHFADADGLTVAYSKACFYLGTLCIKENSHHGKLPETLSDAAPLWAFCNYACGDCVLELRQLLNQTSIEFPQVCASCETHALTTQEGHPPAPLADQRRPAVKSWRVLQSCYSSSPLVDWRSASSGCPQVQHVSTALRTTF